MQAYRVRLDQLEQGNAVGGDAGEVEAIQCSATCPTPKRKMTPRRFPPLWTFVEPHCNGMLVGTDEGEEFDSFRECEARAELIGKERCHVSSIGLCGSLIWRTGAPLTR